MKLQHKVHAFLDKINLKTYENVILSTYSTLVVLRYIHEEDGATKHGEEVNNNKQWDQGSPAQTKDPGGFRSDDCSDQLGNQESPTPNKNSGGSLRTSIQTSLDLHNELTITLWS
jgi:hypothetical protein